MALERQLHHDDFPKSSTYDPEWVIANEMGPNVLWLTEALCEVMDLRPGMRVLDLGCGKAMSSIFLAKECGVEVWATDLWIPATENAARIREAGLEDQVFPVHAEARRLPYADDFFDAIVSLDSFHYFGTDVHYLEFHLLKLLKRGGRIGIVSPAALREGPLPECLPASEWYWMNSVAWWERHWARYPEVEVELSEALPGGWELWVRWLEFLESTGRANRAEENTRELAQLREDAGKYLGFVRQVARRRPG
ncbi:MAG: SAM-dependent methyltransferase [Planctomycetota bacterium]|jgi:cyclopropane fatty-acyl-phospholipid synthase-like methyltransferase